MIGWWIVVAAQTPERRDQAADRRAAALGNWEVGPRGIAWLHQLVKARTATQLCFSGYPNRYTAKSPRCAAAACRRTACAQRSGLIGENNVMLEGQFDFFTQRRSPSVLPINY
jgi:hypothetical protein